MVTDPAEKVSRGRLGAFILVVVLVAGFVWVLQPGSDDKPAVSLGDGFTVAAGTELLGAVFPMEELTWPLGGGHDTWVAHLRVTGNSVKVMNAYLKQARAEKYETAVQCFYQFDQPAGSPDPADTRMSVSRHIPKRRGVYILKCEGLGVIRDGDSILEFVTIVLIQGADLGPFASRSNKEFPIPVNGLTIQVTHFKPGERESAGEAEWNVLSSESWDPLIWRRSLPESWQHGVPASPRPVAIPVVGQRMYEDPPASANHHVNVFNRVEKGTEILAGPVASCPNGTGRILLGRVVGNRDAALHAYVERINATIKPDALYNLFTPASVVESSFRGQRATSISTTDVESGELIVEIIAIGGAHPALKIAHCFY